MVDLPLVATKLVICYNGAVEEISSLDHRVSTSLLNLKELHSYIESDLLEYIMCGYWSSFSNGP